MKSVRQTRSLSLSHSKARSFLDAIWRTDLDWMVIHRDRLVLLSFMNPIGNTSSPITPQPYVTLIPDEGMNEDLDEFATSPGMTNAALPDVVENRVGEAATTFSTVLQPIATSPPLFRTTSSPGATSGRTTASTTTSTSTETTPTTLRTTMAPRSSIASRRPTPRTVVRNGGSKGRSKAKNLTRLSSTARPSRATVAGNMTAQSMSLMMNSLADLDHPENLNLELQTGKPDDLFGLLAL